MKISFLVLSGFCMLAMGVSMHAMHTMKPMSKESIQNKLPDRVRYEMSIVKDIENQSIWDNQFTLCQLMKQIVNIVSGYDDVDYMASAQRMNRLVHEKQMLVNRVPMIAQWLDNEIKRREKDVAKFNKQIADDWPTLQNKAPTVLAGTIPLDAQKDFVQRNYTSWGYDTVYVWDNTQRLLEALEDLAKKKPFNAFEFDEVILSFGLNWMKKPTTMAVLNDAKKRLSENNDALLYKDIQDQFLKLVATTFPDNKDINQEVAKYLSDTSISELDKRAFLLEGLQKLEYGMRIFDKAKSHLTIEGFRSKVNELQSLLSVVLNYFKNAMPSLVAALKQRIEEELQVGERMVVIEGAAYEFKVRNKEEVKEERAKKAREEQEALRVQRETERYKRREAWDAELKKQGPTFWLSGVVEESMDLAADKKQAFLERITRLDRAYQNSKFDEFAAILQELEEEKLFERTVAELKRTLDRVLKVIQDQKDEQEQKARQEQWDKDRKQSNDTIETLVNDALKARGKDLSPLISAMDDAVKKRIIIDPLLDMFDHTKRAAALNDFLDTMQALDKGKIDIESEKKKFQKEYYIYDSSAMVKFFESYALLNAQITNTKKSRSFAQKLRILNTAVDIPYGYDRTALGNVLVAIQALYEDPRNPIRTNGLNNAHTLLTFLRDLQAQLLMEKIVTGFTQNSSERKFFESNQARMIEALAEVADNKRGAVCTKFWECMIDIIQQQGGNRTKLRADLNALRGGKGEFLIMMLDAYEKSRSDARAAQAKKKQEEKQPGAPAQPASDEQKKAGGEAASAAQ